MAVAKERRVFGYRPNKAIRSHRCFHISNKLFFITSLFRPTRAHTVYDFIGSIVVVTVSLRTCAQICVSHTLKFRFSNALVEMPRDKLLIFLRFPIIMAYKIDRQTKATCKLSEDTKIVQLWKLLAVSVLPMVLWLRLNSIAMLFGTRHIGRMLSIQKCRETIKVQCLSLSFARVRFNCLHQVVRIHCVSATF